MLVNHFTEDVLHKKTVAELRDIIKEKGLKATPKMRKADLIALILGEDESSVFNDATKKLAERIQKELDEAKKEMKRLKEENQLSILTMKVVRWVLI